MLKIKNVFLMSVKLYHHIIIKIKNKVFIVKNINQIKCSMLNIKNVFLIIVIKFHHIIIQIKNKVFIVININQI